MNFNIITDSTSDITQLNAKEKNIKVVPLRILFEDGEYHDGINISTEEFYTKLETSKILPQTSQPSPEDFVKIFEEAKTKNNARKIKRERTLAAAKQALQNAQAKGVSPALLRELEKSIEALEALTEAVTKSIKDISDQEFNLLINRVLDAIDACGDSGLTFSSETERAAQVKERMERGKTHIENSCPSAIASAIQDAITKFNLEVDNNLVINITDDETIPIKEKHAEEIHYLECPECHKKTLIPEGKCFTCIECHYQKCD